MSKAKNLYTETKRYNCRKCGGGKEMDKVKDLVSSAEQIERVNVGHRKGKWDIDGLKTALKQMFPGKPGARRVLVDKIMAFHSTGDIKHRAYYAKQKIAEAVEELGWQLVAITARKIGGKEYIEFEVKF